MKIFGINLLQIFLKYINIKYSWLTQIMQKACDDYNSEEKKIQYFKFDGIIAVILFKHKLKIFI